MTRIIPHDFMGEVDLTWTLPGTYIYIRALEQSFFAYWLRVHMRRIKFKAFGWWEKHTINTCGCLGIIRLVILSLLIKDAFEDNKFWSICSCGMHWINITFSTHHTWKIKSNSWPFSTIIMLHPLSHPFQTKFKHLEWLWWD